jgi:pSer/pThr/pTyr-binding forkhead associated (FHA) protein
MSRLIMRRGPQTGKVFELNADIVTIGSGSKNAVVILDNDVSREHCRLIRVMADYEVQDLKSVRGTFVSGMRVTANRVLKPGDIIELGENITLEYERSAVNAELDQAPASQEVVVHSEQPDVDSHPYLVMILGPKTGQVYPLTNPILKLGRDLGNDIVVQDPEVSRYHLKLQWMDKTYQVEDNESTNGTLLNGAVLPPKTPKLLHTNDVIKVASMVELRYTWQPDDVVNTSQPPASPPTTKSVSAETETGEQKIFNPMSITSRRQTSKLGTGLQPGSLVDHVFITYAREEWESIVAPLTIILQDAGEKVWVDQYLVQGGDDWLIAVEQALSECWLLVVVVSPEAMDSRYVRLAYRYFFNREKPIIPLLYAPVHELPRELVNIKPVRYDSHNRKQFFDGFVAAIKGRK